jgi:drug/metabolite transporter (DMT)-like permease
MNLDKERQGELFILLEIVLWGIFPVITVLSYKGLHPFASLWISTVISTFFFAGLVTVRKKWPEVKKTHTYKDIFIATAFVVFFYILYYSALEHTSPGNASIVALTETFFSYLFFNLWRKEHMLREHMIGAILMIIGAVIVLYPNTKELNIGDLFILLGAATIPFGNFFQRRARSKVSSEVIMFVRSVIATIMISVVILVFKIQMPSNEIQKSLTFLVINGVLVLGLSKVFWLEAIHRINVAKAVALNAGAPLITLLFAWAFLHHVPTIWQMVSLIPMFFGVMMLSLQKKS